MFSIENVLVEHYSTLGDVIVIPSMAGKCEFLLVVKNASGSETVQQEIGSGYRRYMQETFGLKFHQLDGISFCGPGRLQEQYKELLNQLLQTDWIPVDEYSQLEAVPHAVTDMRVLENEIVHCMQYGTWEKTQSLIRTWVAELQASGRPSIIMVFNHVCELLRTMYSTVDHPFKKGSETVKPTLRMIKLEAFYEIGLHVESLVSYLCSEAGAIRMTIQKNQPKSDIERIAGYLDAHFSQDISLDELSGKFHLSKSYICKAFKKRFACTITEYVTGVRLERARVYLQEKGYLAQTAAEFVGFQDYPYFSKLYKRRFGHPPSAEAGVSEPACRA
jgi:AraC-like DNA-binding protein